MKKIYNYICKIPRDKWMHLCVSAMIAVVLKHSFLVLDVPYAVHMSFLATITIGVLKEVYDKTTGKGTPEFKDFVFDVIGAIIGVL